MKIEEVTSSEFERAKGLRYRRNNFQEIRKRMNELEPGGTPICITFNGATEKRPGSLAYNTHRSLLSYEIRYPRTDKFEIVYLKAEKSIYIRKLKIKCTK